MLLHHLLAWISVLWALSPQDADDTAAKARLAEAIAATGLKHEATASGLSFSVLFTHEKDRRQTVYVSREPNRPSGLVTHTIFTNVWVGKSAPDEATMRKVFAIVKKLGSFYLLQDSKGQWAIRFGVHFDATELRAGAKPGDRLVKNLGHLIRFVNAVGEETDLQLNGADDLK